MFRHVMFQLTESQQQLLLQIARESVQAHLLKQPLPLRHVTAGTLIEAHGIFVSIHQRGELRGCIGNVHPVEPLVRSTSECAIAAAVDDPRFVPLTFSELRDVDFEISVLSLMEPVQDVAAIEVGKHGLFISKNHCRGLLLPQVAAAYGWSRERFLEETCKKAGLRPDEWKRGAAIHRFSAFVFGEKQFHAKRKLEDAQQHLSSIS
jgi:AmmeMemoRadiSam system protein A